MLKLKINRRIILFIAAFIAIDVLSYLALLSSGLNKVIFIILTLACFLISIYRLEYGLLMVLAELIIGSMGHMFVFSLGGYNLPIRMALWGVVMAVFSVSFVWQLIKKGKESRYLKKIKDFSLLKYFILLAFAAVIGLINAFLRGHAFGLIFNDFNSWLYWLLLFPAIVVYSRGKAEERDKKIFDNLKIIFFSGAIFLSLKTLFLIYIFTHNISFSSEIYTWLRKTLVGEMTPTLSGWPRVFIQGQIFSGVAMFLVFWQSLKIKKEEYGKSIGYIALTALFISSILISFSRSFWAGIAGAVFFSFIAIWRGYSFKKAVVSMFWLLISALVGFSIIYSVSIIPYPSKGEFNADFIERVSGDKNEPALASRWSLLPVLIKEIKKEPFLGQGFGATVTYFSQDPRVLQNNPTGEYTTYAFEWGYLDLWLKIGFFGLAAYLLLIFFLVRDSLSADFKNSDLILPGIGAGLIFLALTNFFTPYLNHPLGIGILIIGACLIQKDRVY